ncbi:MAG: HTH domain-containing protein [Candidatus Sumerlaeia bacterium]|nr:HTH domain-containing protein [Candidatus Sumerlaeia bacterium]
MGNGDEKLDRNEEQSGEKAKRLVEKLGENKAAIVILMLKTPEITVNELGDQLEISRNTVDRNIQKLKKDGVLERIGPAKGGYWKVNLEMLDEKK